MGDKRDKKTLDDVLGLARTGGIAHIKTVPLFLAPADLVAEHEQLTAQAEREAQTRNAGSLDDAGITQIADRLVELEDELATYEIDFRFKSLPPKVYRDLYRDHPPTREQTKLDARIEYNDETFPAALISTCLTDPKVTPEQVAEWDAGVETDDGETVSIMSDTQFNSLFNAAIEVNVSGGGSPKSLVAGAARHLKSQSEQPATTTESLDLSSLDG